jgi:uncharacterized phage-associated protein
MLWLGLLVFRLFISVWKGMVMKRINAIRLAEFILSSYGEVEISPMKLQKLAYYAKVWSVVAGKNFIDADFEKWDYGPVNRDIFHEYKRFSKSPIPASVIEEEVRLEPAQEDFIDFVLRNYIDLSAVALSMQTHKEDPWISTPPNAVISESVIKDYYSRQNFAKNFTRDNYRKGPFYVVKTNSWHSFTMDMDSKEAEFYESYPSFEEYIEGTEKAAFDIDKLFNEFMSDTSAR